MERQTKTIKVGETVQWIKELVAKLRPELDSQNPHCKRRDTILPSCPLTSLILAFFFFLNGFECLGPLWL